VARPLLVLGFVGLVVGAGAGLARLGWTVPALAASASALHGPLMICGFFGVVIALERAVAIGRLWAYAAPLCAGLAGAAAVAGATSIAPWLFFAASLGFVAASLDVWRRQRALFTFTLTLARCAGRSQRRLGPGSAVHEIVAWWLAFLILTIAGERLELSRFLPPSPIAKRVFAAILVAIGVGLVGARWPWGGMLHAAGLLALALWLLKQDIARRTVRGRVSRGSSLSACCRATRGLAAGSAVMLGAGGLAPGTPAYDAALHALALGFVFSMVFGHAPIIFPAVLRVAVPYHPTFLPAAGAAARLAARAPDRRRDRRFRLDARWRTRQCGGAGAFIVSTASAVVRGRTTTA